MKRPILSIDARMLFASGTGTYLQNLLKRIRFETLGVQVHAYVHTEGAATWMRQYQPNATVKYCPEWVFGLKEQLFWRKNLCGGAFWSPNFNIPWGGYEKLIVTVHDCFPLTALGNLWQRLYAKLMFRRIRQKADAIITVSEFSKHEIQSHAKILNTPIHVVHNGVDPHWFTSTLPPKPYPFDYFVYVGNLRPQKNLRALLRAYQRAGLRERLVCVGPFRNLKGRGNGTLRLLKKLSPQVIGTDYVEDDALRAIVKNSQGLVHPSLYEGFGMPPLEAMAARVPVLVSQTASMPEICGNSALYCDPFTVEGIGEGLQKLASLKGVERALKIEEGFEHAAQFNWDAAAQATFDVFRQTLA